MPLTVDNSVRTGHRQAARRLHAFECRCDRGTFSCPSDSLKAEPAPGTWQIRSRHHALTAPTCRPEQPVAADRHPVDFRPEGVGFETFSGDGPILLNSARRRRTDGRPRSFNDPRITWPSTRPPTWSRPSSRPCWITSCDCESRSHRRTVSTSMRRNAAKICSGQQRAV